MLARRRGPLLVVGLLAACSKLETPRELRLELPEVVTSKDPVVVQVRGYRQDGSPYQARGALAFRVEPPELATVTERGVLSCQRSGDGSVTLAIGGVTAKAKLACKLVARLEVPEKLTLDVATGEADPRVRALDATGQTLELPISITSNRGGVVQVRGGRLLPLSVGMAKLSVRAGELSRQVEVEVVRTLRPEIVPVDQNRRISYSLDAGKYRLHIVLPASRKISVDWLGAPYCQYRGDKAEHVAECTLQNKGSVSFDNPAFLLRGDKMPSVEGVTLREVP